MRGRLDKPDQRIGCRSRLLQKSHMSGIGKPDHFRLRMFRRKLLRNFNRDIPVLAAEDEKSEHETIYPSFARIAREEGYGDIARRFDEVAKVEENHEIIFRYLHEAVRDGSLYACEHPVIWVCGECGYMHTAKEAWKVCPLCGAKQGEVDLHLPYKGV